LLLNNLQTRWRDPFGLHVNDADGDAVSTEKRACIRIISDVHGGDMAEAKQSHHHPDYDQRIKALEEQIKKLQKEMQDLKQKLETHDHPHTH
jgi:prefoldin subunit 5